jgi:threonine synthase
LDASAAAHPPDEFEALKLLSDFTGEPVHPALLDLEKRPQLHRRVCRRDEMKSVVLSIESGALNF